LCEECAHVVVIGRCCCICKYNFPRGTGKQMMRSQPPELSCHATSGSRLLDQRARSQYKARHFLQVLMCFAYAFLVRKETRNTSWRAPRLIFHGFYIQAYGTPSTALHSCITESEQTTTLQAHHSAGLPSGLAGLPRRQAAERHSTAPPLSKHRPNSARLKRGLWANQPSFKQAVLELTASLAHVAIDRDCVCFGH